MGTSHWCTFSASFFCKIVFYLKLYHQGFTQVILMSDRRHEKLNLLIEFSNSNLLIFNNKDTRFVIVNFQQISYLVLVFLLLTHSSQRAFIPSFKIIPPSWVPPGFPPSQFIVMYVCMYVCVYVCMYVCM